jgi:hypothetical protein
LVWSICALALVMIDDWPDLGSEQRSISAKQFIRRCRQLRIEWEYMETAVIEDCLASLFIANAYFELKCRSASWYFVREAVTLGECKTFMSLPVVLLWLKISLTYLNCTQLR